MEGPATPDRGDLLPLQFQEVGAVGRGAWGRGREAAHSRGVLGEAEKGCRPLSSGLPGFLTWGQGVPLGPLPWPPCRTLLPLPLLPPPLGTQPLWPRGCACSPDCPVARPFSAPPCCALAGKLLLQSPHVGTSSFFWDERADRRLGLSPFCPGLPCPSPRARGHVLTGQCPRAEAQV